ncbi:MAG: TRAP transporter large permease [Pseudodonghicola sp.]
MSDLFIGGCGIGAIFILMALRVPIAFALGTVSFFGIWLVRSERAAFGTLGSLPQEFASSWELSAIPMFLLMGAAAFQFGLTGKLYDAARLWLHRLPGGLAIATNLTAAGFAAASGSSVATSATVGRLAIPEMLRHGYDKALATGTVAASGTLGALIPPSIAFVIYGWFTEQPVGQLLMAGLIPGILTAVLYSIMIVVRVTFRPGLAPRAEIKPTRQEKMAALRQVWPMPLLILCVIGSIYSGIATPTEAGALGAMFTFIIGALSGGMSLKAAWGSVKDSLVSTASLFAIAMGAVLLTRFLAMAGVPTFVANLVTNLDMSPVQLVAAMCVIYLVLGMFLDPMGVMLLTLPVFLPAFNATDTNLIWIGVIVVKMIEIGLLTPPVGLNVYVVKAVAGAEVSLATVFRGVGWFLLCELLLMIFLIALPGLSLWLPAYMTN